MKILHIMWKFCYCHNFEIPPPLPISLLQFGLDNGDVAHLMLFKQNTVGYTFIEKNIEIYNNNYKSE